MLEAAMHAQENANTMASERDGANELVKTHYTQLIGARNQLEEAYKHKSEFQAQVDAKGAELFQKLTTAEGIISDLTTAKNEVGKQKTALNVERNAALKKVANLEIQFRKISSFNNIVSKKNIELENKLKSCVQKEKQIQGRHEKERNIHERITERQKEEQLTFMRNKSSINLEIQQLENQLLREAKEREERQKMAIQGEKREEIEMNELARPEAIQSPEEKEKQGKDRHDMIMNIIGTREVDTDMQDKDMQDKNMQSKDIQGGVNHREVLFKMIDDDNEQTDLFISNERQKLAAGLSQIEENRREIAADETI